MLQLPQEEAFKAGLQLSAPKCKLRHRCDVCDRSFDTQQGLRIHKARWCMGKEGPVRSRKSTRANKLVQRDKCKSIEEN